MGKIIKLDPVLANQIAAGEVVERPLSVVKELLENSIDAGANEIRIEIEEWGIESITISDNGEGIEKEDLSIMSQKHTTSKIKNLQDLQSVMTFGFRGEAIASIASVSELQIISKHKNSEIWYRFIDGEITEHPSETGTKIIVEKLFSKTPARLHYLKKPRTEQAKIHEYINAMALMYPNVSFEFYVDDAQVFLYRAGESLEKRIYMILWSVFWENLLAIESGIAWLKIHGYISDPKVNFNNKNKQLLYVNQRLIKSPMIAKAMYDAFNRYIPHKTQPAYVLNIDLDPTQVDVNVHPRKQEIRFADESQIFRLVYHAVHDTLQWLSLAHPGATKSPDSSVSQTTEKTPEYYTGSGTKFKSYSPYKNTQTNPDQSHIKNALNFSKAISSDSWNRWTSHSFDQSYTQSEKDLHRTKMWKIIGQAFNSYIIVETPDSLQILDQHALAERIIYEKLIKNTHDFNTQWLLLAESFNLSPTEFELIEKHAESMKWFWFDFELLGNNILQITAIPDFIKKNDLRKVVEWVIEDLGNSKMQTSHTLEEIQNSIAAYTACRSAIKFGDPLTLLEMHTLLNDAVTDYSATCPHGRPVISNLDLETLKNMYDR